MASIFRGDSFALTDTAFLSAEGVFVVVLLICAVMFWRYRRAAIAIWYFIGGLFALICMFILFIFEVRMTGGV